MALRKVIFAAILSTIFLITSCATTITTRMATQNYLSTQSTKETIDAITFVLTDNGFDIAFMNDSYGLVNTNYRKIRSGTDTALTVLSILGAASSRSSSSYSSFEREMMLSIQISDNGYKVIPKMRRITKSYSGFGTSASDYVEYPKSDTPEGQLVNKIIREINLLLGIQDNIVWEEKEISIKDN